MRTILGTEQYSQKNIIEISIGYGIAGRKEEVQKGDARESLEGALSFIQEAGGKNFSLSFSDGTKQIWKWDNQQQAFVPVL
jgi:hypothetical protein